LVIFFVTFSDLKVCKGSNDPKKCNMVLATAEKYLECIYSHRECASDLKRVLAITDIAKHPELVNDQTNLSEYIEHLTSSEKAGEEPSSSR